MYDPATNIWTQITRMQSPRYAHGAVAYKGFIYAIGGHDGSKYLDTGEKYDPQTNTWSPIPPMNSPRAYFGIAALNDSIYIIGGSNNGSTLDLVESFNAQENEWFEIRFVFGFIFSIKIIFLKKYRVVKKPMSIERKDFSACTI